MKKNATRYCATAYYRMCSTDVYCSKQTGSSSTKGNHHPSFLRFWIKQKKLSMQPKFVAAQKMLLKQKPSKTFVNGLLGLYYFRRIYTRWKRVYCLTIIAMSCPSIWATLSALLINILLGSFQLFLHSDQPLSGGNNPVQRCLPVGEAALSTPEAVVASRTDWQTALMCNRRRPAATSSRRASFSALASANSFCVFCIERSNITLTICMSVIAAFASQQSSAFLSRCFVGNGVITVMINSPWQADDDADNQSGDNRGDSAHTSISLTVPPASLNFAIRLSALCSNCS